MGKLSKLFMVLSVLSFAVPAFAQGEARKRRQLGCHRRWIFHGLCLRHLRFGAGQGDRFRR